MIYSYQAKDQQGRTVTGSLDAPDERQAAQEIRGMGYFPMRLAPQRGGAATFSPSYTARQSSAAGYAARPRAMSPGRWLLVHLIFPIWSGVGLRDMALMYRQFSAMINAGVPDLPGLDHADAADKQRSFAGLSAKNQRARPGRRDADRGHERVPVDFHGVPPGDDRGGRDRPGGWT